MSWSTWILCLLFLMNCIICFNIKAESSGSASDFFTPRINLETPHIAWAKPYKGGPLKILFIIPRSGMREVLEIAERLDVQYDIFAALTCSQLAPAQATADDPAGSDYKSQLERLLQFLKKDYDLIMIGGVNWTMLPLEARYLILKKIKGGTGLLGCIPERDEYIGKVLKKDADNELYKNFENNMQGFPFELVPGFNTALSRREFVSKNAELFSFGKGKICLFKYPLGGIRDRQSKWLADRPQHPFVPGVAGSVLQADYTDYDFQLAFVIKSVLWALNKKTAASLIPGDILTKEDGTSALSFRIATGEVTEANAELFILNEYGDKVFSANKDKQPDAGEYQITFQIPSLPTGKYRISLIVKDKDGKVMDFAFFAWHLKTEYGINEVVFGKQSFSHKEAVTGKLSISDCPPEGKVKLTLLDNWGRMLAKSEHSAAKSIDFSMPHATSLTVVNTIIAELVGKDNKLLALYKIRYTINDMLPPTDEMRTLLWSDLNQDTFYALPVFEYWRKNGIDTHYVWFTEWVSRANMRHIEIIDRIADNAADWVQETQRNKDGGIRNPCLSDPKYIENTIKNYANKIGKLKNYSVCEFSMGDECHLTSKNNDVCFSKYSIRSFQEFVRKKYGNIEGLNKAYGTAYKSFEDVKPVYLTEAQKTNQIACWIDHKLHMNAVWNSIFELGRNVAGEFIAQSKTGYEGSDHCDIVMWNLGDFRQLAETMSFCALYYRPFDAAAWRSFMSKEKLFGPGVFGGYGAPIHKKQHPDALYMPWMNLFKGGNLYLLWMAAPYGGSITAPDYSFNTFFNDALVQMSEIKNGLDKLLIRSRRVTDCAILYSPSSIFASAFLKSPTAGVSDFNNITQLILDTGFQPEVYHSEEIATGILGKNPPKFLFLMGTTALSSAEINEIKAYVKKGGVVIADLQPGVRDTSGKVYNNLSLAELFGATTDNIPDFKLNSQLKLTSEFEIKEQFPPVYSDPSTKLSGGKAYCEISGVPAIICNNYGNGKAILLNFNINDYQSTRKSWEKSPLRNLFKKIFSEIAGVQSEAHVLPEIPGLETTCFQNGNIRYVTLLQDMIGETSCGAGGGIRYNSCEVPERREQVSVQVKLDRPGHMYNVRTGKYLGYSESATVPVRILEGSIIASLPYKVKNLELKTAENKFKQGDRFSLTVRVIPETTAESEEHIVILRFFDPSGKEAEYYRKKLIAKGPVTESFNLSLNEIPGQWTVKAEDVATRTQASADFAVIAEEKN